MGRGPAGFEDLCPGMRAPSALKPITRTSQEAAIGEGGRAVFLSFILQTALGLQLCVQPLP